MLVINNTFPRKKQKQANMNIFTKNQVGSLISWFVETGNTIPTGFKQFLETAAAPTETPEKKETAEPKRKPKIKFIYKKKAEIKETETPDPKKQREELQILHMDNSTKKFNVNRRTPSKPEVCSDDMFGCTMCPKKFSNYTTWSFHQTHAHTRKFECPHDSCNKTFGVIGNLKQHYSRKHITENTFTIRLTNGKKIYECNKCGKNFKSEPSIHGHVTECYGYCFGVNYHH